jgi:ABC-type multidrug transport system permease subunit
VFQPPDALPGFWIFMYRLSPLTYIIGGLSATGLSGSPVRCSTTETKIFQPPSGQNCGDYLTAYLQTAPGQLTNPGALSNCSYCPLRTADQFLSASEIAWDDRWRNFGIVWAYICFNIAAAMLLYFVFRVSNWKPATLEQRKQRWRRVGTWARLAVTVIQILGIGMIGQGSSLGHKSGNTVSYIVWDDQDAW